MSQLRAASLLALILGVGGLSPAIGADMKTLVGEITVAPELADSIGADDRLIIKLYHPEGEKQLDQSYQIVSSFTLPLRFTAAPGTDMSKRTKWQHYVVEVFTDKNNDVLGTAEGELIGRTTEALALGSKDIRIVLDAERQPR